MKATPVEANRTLTCLSAVFGYADRAELVPTGFNPTRHVERYAETGKRRALSTEELQALCSSSMRGGARTVSRPEIWRCSRILGWGKS
jgi:hypothetical protein